HVGAPTSIDRFLPLSENSARPFAGITLRTRGRYGQGRQRRRAHPGAAQRRAQVPPTQGVREAGARQERGGLSRGGEEPGAVLGAAREGAHLVQAVEEDARLEAAV